VSGRRQENPPELRKGERPDVDIRTAVRAKELRFDKVPETRVWFSGDPDMRASVRSERKNLPEEVEPDVTYRDVSVRWTAGARVVHPADAAEESEEDGSEED
jgi:hypothetical protein